MVKRIIYLMMVLMALSGCSYSVYSNVYPHLKKIRVMPFENQSAEFGISEKVYNQLSVAFRNDGRLKVVNQQPDCLLEGGVISFEERVYSYDAANNVQDYQLRLTLAISFTDLIRNEVIYENKSLTLMEAYAVSTESTAKSKSKEEAIDELINSLFKTVVQNSLEKW